MIPTRAEQVGSRMAEYNKIYFVKPIYVKSDCKIRKIRYLFTDMKGEVRRGLSAQPAASDKMGLAEDLGPHYRRRGF